jgi:hypothetical protein
MQGRCQLPVQNMHILIQKSTNKMHFVGWLLNWLSMMHRMNNIKLMHFPIGHVLIPGKWHSNILGIQSFKLASSDADHCLVVAKFMQSFSE